MGSTVITGASRSHSWSIQDWLIFLVFLGYGPAFNFLGQLRYTEALILLITPLFLKEMYSAQSGYTRKFSSLCVFVSFVYLVMDSFNGVSFNDSVKTSGSYIILAVLVFAVMFIGRHRPQRLRAMIYGYCLSYVLLVYTGQSVSAAYNLEPWRLGLGSAVTLMICAWIATSERRHNFAGAILLTLALIHVIFGARSLALMTAFAGVFAIVSSQGLKRVPIRLSFKQALFSLLVICAFLLSAFQFAKVATEEEWWPSQLQQRMELQLNNPYGLLAAARPDTATAVKAIEKKPLVGFGSTNVDPEIYEYYLLVSSANARSQSQRDALINAKISQEWDNGTPSHSHIFRAWADAGVLAIVLWLYALYLCFVVVGRSLNWRSAWQPMLLFVAISTAWHILFSPGPHRMDMAIRIVILSIGLSQMARLTSGFSNVRRDTKRSFYQWRSDGRKGARHIIRRRQL